MFQWVWGGAWKLAFLTEVVHVTLWEMLAWVKEIGHQLTESYKPMNSLLQGMDCVLFNLRPLSTKMRQRSPCDKCLLNECIHSKWVSQVLKFSQRTIYIAREGEIHWVSIYINNCSFLIPEGWRQTPPLFKAVWGVANCILRLYPSFGFHSWSHLVMHIQT